MSRIQIKKTKSVSGTIKLDGSKSISNRVLIIRALAQKAFKIDNLSTSDDTETLAKLLSSDEHTLNTGHAGTTFRFMTAYLAFSGEERVLTGSARMKERPIGPLVDALNTLGAKISYQEKEGYPPLKFSPSECINNEVEIDAGISSQFLSALLLIAPSLPNGLRLKLKGDLVSRPYLEMTLRIMAHFGVNHRWEETCIEIKKQNYGSSDFTVESDWSAASYYYSIAALVESADLSLVGLFKDSLQGDAAMIDLGIKIGVSSEWKEDGSLRLAKVSRSGSMLEYDFINQPDLAQTISVAVGGLGMHGLYTGLKTLEIKETDRIQALKNELQKVGVSLSQLPPRFSEKSGLKYFMQQGKAGALDKEDLFETYKDHRMAMAFAPLACLFDITIEDPKVVSKSYPNFWNDMDSIGFKLINLD